MNDLVSLHKPSSPLDYPIQTNFISFISLCAFYEVYLILTLGTLKLTDIDHVSIMKSMSTPHQKEVESPAKVKPTHASIYRELNPARSLCWMHRFKD